MVCSVFGNGCVGMVIFHCFRNEQLHLLSKHFLPFLPSDTQMKILNQYGMKRMSDYIYGENAFMLLYNMSVDQWRIDYKPRDIPE